MSDDFNKLFGSPKPRRKRGENGIGDAINTYMSNVAPDEKPTKKKKKQGVEAKLQADILKALAKMPDVVWVQRINSGSVKAAGRYISMAKKGTADIMGMMKGGQTFAIEVKQAGKYASKAQKEFLKMINDGGGVGFVARSVGDVVEGLK